MSMDKRHAFYTGKETVFLSENLLRHHGSKSLRCTQSSPLCSAANENLAHDPIKWEQTQPGMSQHLVPSSVGGRLWWIPTTLVFARWRYFQGGGGRTSGDKIMSAPGDLAGSEPLLAPLHTLTHAESPGPREHRAQGFSSSSRHLLLRRCL